ncbi:ISA1 [Auxenochlorella protothecoides x Auxenochlorella symbiontica]
MHTEAGFPLPLGASWNEATGAVNFAVYSSSATSMFLCLSTPADHALGRLTREIAFDPIVNRTGDTWHLAVVGLDSNLLYGFKVEPCGTSFSEPDGGTAGAKPRSHVLLDPHARTVVNGRTRFGQLGPDIEYGSPGVYGTGPTWPLTLATLPHAAPAEPFDWEGDRPLGRPMEDLVIYEMHVRGFTAHTSSGVGAPGTYSGVIEKLDYLQDLGISAVELLPIHEFNELEYYDGGSPARYNFWGYSTLAFQAPMARYAASDAATEFKQLVKACHQRGIEVILDVVFNHTAEGSEAGPTLSFRGLDNTTYYMLAPGGQCYNYSGCGNTLNCNHPVVSAFILDCLRTWVLDFHVDGFRFDLGSILTRAPSMWIRPKGCGGGGKHEDAARGEAAGARMSGATSPPPPQGPRHMDAGAGSATGTPLSDPGLIEAISTDPVLARTKLIAEAWDCGGLVQVGAFPHHAGRWSEWNGRFRDAARAFLKGSPGAHAGAFAAALCASPDVFLHAAPEGDWWGRGLGAAWRGGRGPAASVNLVTAHDGFSLADLVAYNEKHNEANGEGGRDGETHNLSWNCGEEGPTRDPGVAGLRARQARNHAAALLLAQGVPMLVQGDEYGHSKGGNNNTYCHDSPLNWLDWRAASADEGGLARFVRALLALRAAHPALREKGWRGGGDLVWHGPVAGEEPGWGEDGRFVAFSLPESDGGGLYVAFNAGHGAVTAALPARAGRVWEVALDSGRAPPFDVLTADSALSADQVHAVRAAGEPWRRAGVLPMLPYSCAVCVSVPDPLTSA